MFEAYKCFQIAGKLPLQIDAVTAQDSCLLAGTKNGCLLSYTSTGDTEHSVQISKNFSKKAVTQLAAIPECEILISLSDGLIAVHSSVQVNFPLITTLPKAKGASAFSVAVEELWADDARSYSLKMCVNVKRKLLTFVWQEQEFVELPAEEFALQDIPKCMALLHDTIALGFRDEYFLVTVPSEKNNQQTKKLDPLFSTGNKSIEPYILCLEPYSMLGFQRDDRLVFTSVAGKSIPEQTDIAWTEVPVAFAVDPPYIIAALSKHVEIRSVRPTSLIQVIDVQKPKLITCAISCVLYVACVNDVWCLSAMPNLKNNLQRLMKDSQFELAIQLADNITDEEPDEIEERIREIKHLYAFHLFRQKKFSAAFSLYSSIRAEVLYVICLFPDLLPSDCRQNVVHPGPLPTDFTKADLKDGLWCLYNYLIEVRTNIAKDLSEYEKKPGKAVDKKVGLTELEVKERKTLLQILDTTLLKCLLQTNEMLVPSLLRLKDNSCNVAESERVLMKNKKYALLYLLYEQKQMHVAALELLKDHASIPDSPLKGRDRTIYHLLKLGPSHIDLIFQYAEWVMKEDSSDGIMIFTDDSEEVKTLPREKVVDYLLHVAPSQVVAYLEHIIKNWKETRPDFHNTLAEHMIEDVRRGIVDYLQSLPEGHSVAPAGKEPGELGALRRNLIAFLNSSKSYSPELLLVQIPHDAMYEERALIFGRLGKHEQAIAIYTNILLDYYQAELYCRQHYSATSDRPQDASVYLILLQMYANPPDNTIIGIHQAHMPKPPPNVSLALRVLKDYAPYINAVKAVEMLPLELHLESLWCALEMILQSTSSKRRNVEIRRGLKFAQHMKVQMKSMKETNVKIVIDHNSECSKCHKKIANSAFARLPSGQLVHYYCYKQQ